MLYTDKAITKLTAPNTKANTMQMHLGLLENFSANNFLVEFGVMITNNGPLSSSELKKVRFSAPVKIKIRKVDKILLKSLHQIQSVYLLDTPGKSVLNTSTKCWMDAPSVDWVTHKDIILENKSK